MATATAELVTKAKAARAAARELRTVPTGPKNAALEAIATALERDLGYRPTTPLADGVRAFVDWYRGYYG